MNKTLKRWLVLLFALALTLSFTACSTKDKPSTSDAGGTNEPATSNPEISARDTINIAVSQDCGTLDPIFITGSGGWLGVANAYMDALFNFTPDGEIIWLLATAYEEVSDTEYILRLREGVTFNNGNPFTAEDVMFTFKVYRDNPSRSLNVISLDLDKTEIIDDYTIKLIYTAPNVSQKLMLNSPLIMDAESYNPDTQTTNPIGTGPYIVKEYVMNDHLTVTARDDYWGGAPAIKTVVYKNYNESSQITNALETGEVDIATVPTSDASYIESLGSYNILKYSTGWCCSAFYNMSPGANLAEKEARYAINYAIDAESIIQASFDGYADSTDWPGSKTLVDYEPRFGGQIDSYVDTYNLEKAKALAEEAGLIGKTLTLITNGGNEYVTMAQIIKSDLDSIGVNVEIVNYDQASFYSKISDVTTFDIALYATAAPSMMAADIYYAYLTFFTCGWEGPERDDYMALAATVLGISDDQERSEVLYESSKMLAEFSPWYGICDKLTISAYNKDIQNYAVTITGSYYVNKLYFAP